MEKKAKPTHEWTPTLERLALALYTRVEQALNGMPTAVDSERGAVAERLSELLDEYAAKHG